MRVTAVLERDIARYMREEIRRAEAVATRAVGESALGLQADWRQAVIAAGLGPRLANTVRLSLYPQGRNSLGAAGYVFTRAPEIMLGHAEGATIRARNARFLAIPTENVPRARAGRRGATKRMTPVEVEAAFNRDLRFVQRPGRPALLVMDEARARFRRATGELRGFKRSRSKTGRGHTSVVMFVLVPQVRLRKAFDLAGIAERWQGRLLQRLEAEMFAGA